MRVTVKLFALLGRFLPPGASANQAEIEVPDGTTPAQVLERQGVPSGAAHLVLINGAYVPPAEWASTTLAEGDALAVWPPVAGG